MAYGNASPELSCIHYSVDRKGNEDEIKKQLFFLLGLKSWAVTASIQGSTSIAAQERNFQQQSCRCCISACLLGAIEKGVRGISIFF
ncbi:hypothetical protein RHMOL_Rhmol02G0080000 [Rhododendron molle]|uniref:Uncharacterized protein n=1 Tax=Rhododendron molle TaxID=49168 RepID=A0ACC0PQD5_RHOML|nr:hypothetical protein RHMOL_Rhmol02G0080000 [Rhododendron molle]